MYRNNVLQVGNRKWNESMGELQKLSRGYSKRIKLNFRGFHNSTGLRARQTRKVGLKSDIRIAVGTWKGVCNKKNTCDSTSDCTSEEQLLERTEYDVFGVEAY